MPKFYKKINNNGFSFVPLIVLVLAVGLVGIFSFSYFQNNKDVLQSSSNRVEVDIITAYDNNSFTFRFRGLNTQLLEEQKRRVASRGLTIETYCDEPTCITKKETIFPSKIDNINGKNNRIEGFTFSVNRPLTKSLQVNDLITDLKSNTVFLTVNGSDRGKWKLQGIVGVIRVSNNLIVEDFNPIPSVKPSLMSFVVSGDGDVFYSLVRNLKDRGVNVRNCNSVGQDCMTSVKRVNRLQADSNKTRYSFSVDISELTSSISLIVDSANLNNTEWRTTSKFNWKYMNDGITLLNSNPTVSIPKISINITNQATYSNIIFTFMGVGDSYNMLKSRLQVSGINYTLSSSSSVKTLIGKCFGNQCEFRAPTNINRVYFTPNTKIEIVNIPYLWKINSGGNGIEKK